MPLKTEAKKSVLMFGCGDPHCVHVLDCKRGSQIIKSGQSHKTDSPSDSMTLWQKEEKLKYIIQFVPYNYPAETLAQGPFRAS